MISDLKKELESFFETKFKSITNRRSGKFYVPEPTDNPSSTRYWLIFSRGLDGSYIIAGDFADPDKKLKKKTSYFPKSIKFSTQTPHSQDYEERLELKHEKIVKFLKSKKKTHGAYLREFERKFNFKPTGYEDNETCILPWKNEETGKITALLLVYKNGVKRWVKGSEPAYCCHWVKDPVGEKSVIYVCEGVRTAYLVAQACPLESGVVSIGSLSNLDSVLSILTKRPNPIVLCSESGEKAQEVYLKNKVKYGCFLAKPADSNDFYDLYKEKNLEFVKSALSTIQEKNIIPLGLEGADRIVVYVKSRGTVISYKKNECKQLLSDCEPNKKEFNKVECENYYFKLRDLCRGYGSEDGFKKIRDGIFPIRGLFFFFDRKCLYIIKEGKLKKVNVLDYVTRDSIFVTGSSPTTFDFEKLKPITRSNINKIFKVLGMFPIKEIERKLIIGWVFQSLLCGGLDFRASLWAYGPSFKGKTRLSNYFLSKLFLFKIKAQGTYTTSKYIVRQTNGRACVIFRDELEPDKFNEGSIREQFEYIRNSATDRFPSRGIASGLTSTEEFTYCFSAFLSSCEIPRRQMSDADFGRIIFIQLNKDLKAEHVHLLQTTFNDFMTDKIKASLLKHALIKLHSVRGLFSTYMKSGVLIDTSSHKRSAILSLVACYNACMEDEIDPNDLNFIVKNQHNIRGSHKSFSAKLSDILQTPLNKNSYDIPETLTLIEIIERALIENNQDSQEKDDHMFKFSATKFLAKKHIFVTKDERLKTSVLLLNEKRSVLFLANILKESKDYISVEKLRSLLKQDGDFLLSSSVEVQKEKIPRAKYIKFDVGLIIKELLTT